VKLHDIASLLGAEIIGHQDIDIIGAAGLHDAHEGDITFIASKKYIRELSHSKASCVIVQEPLSDVHIPQLKVSNPLRAFATLLDHFSIKPSLPGGISPDAMVADDAVLGENVCVFPFAHISRGASIGSGTVIYPYVFIGENTSVGENCLIYPNVTLREGVRIGNRVIIHSGSVIGSDGFGYVFENGTHHKIPQVGGVVIGDDVEIGSNVSVDRATTGNTLIGAGTKIDNLVQIAHNVKVGENAILVSQVGIAGSSEIGDFVILAGQVGISDHTKIDSETVIGAQSGAKGHVKKGAYSGSPAIPHREWLKAQVVFARLPELHKRIRALEEKIKELERRHAE
jgi:UDP-3-O-[3-hydroxymyristoyl] glucosamine N-acyltransferase